MHVFSERKKNITSIHEVLFKPSTFFIELAIDIIGADFVAAYLPWKF